MDASDYQREASTFASYGENPMYPVLGLAEEAGEVCGKIAKFIRKHDGISPVHAMRAFPNTLGDRAQQCKEDVSKELGDVCWMVAMIAYEFGLDLGEIMEQNIQKLTDRKNRGVIVGEGDDR